MSAPRRARRAPQWPGRVVGYSHTGDGKVRARIAASRVWHEGSVVEVAEAVRLERVRLGLPSYAEFARGPS